MYRQAQITKFNLSDDDKPNLMTVDELREEVNSHPEEFFLLCKKFAPTEESSKDLSEAIKRIKLNLQLGNPASVITWLHKCLRAIVAQGVDDSFTEDQGQELMTYWRKHLIEDQLTLAKKTKDKLQAAIFRNSKPPTKMVDMGMRVEGGWSTCHDAFTKADAWGLFDRHNQPAPKRAQESDTASLAPDGKKPKPDTQPQPDPADATHKEKCDHCGNRPALQRKDPCIIGGRCALYNHPDANKLNIPFTASEKGQAYAKVGRYWLMWKNRLQDGSLVDYAKP